MPTPEVTPTSGPTQTGDALARFDLFEAPPDDPIFASAEPFKGLPSEKEIIAGLPEPARQFLHNKGLGARAKVEEANAAVKTATERAAAAEAAAEEWKKKAMGAATAQPAPQAADLAIDPKLAVLYGLADGDPWKDRPLADVADDADNLDDLDDAALADPAKMREILLRIRKQGATAGAAAAVATARADYTDITRLAAKPVLAAQASARQQALQSEAERKTAEFRSAHAGLETDKGFGSFYGYVRELASHTGEGWPTGVNLSAAHKAWSATQGAKAAEPAAAQPASAAAPAAAKPKSELAILTEALRTGAQRSQGSGGVAQSEAALVMPPHVQADPAAMIKWIDQHPRAKRAFAANDQEEIARIMGRRPRG